MSCDGTRGTTIKRKSKNGRERGTTLCILNADAEEEEEEEKQGARRCSEENCSAIERQPIAKVALYAQMNELQYEEYNFKGNSFSAGSFGFQLGETNREEKRRQRG